MSLIADYRYKGDLLSQRRQAWLERKSDKGVVIKIIVNANNYHYNGFKPVYSDWYTNNIKSLK